MTARDLSYDAVMGRKNEIMKASLGIDYDDFIHSPVAFDYERMMLQTDYSHADITRIQRETKVGDTPLYELRNLTAAVRRICEPGKGARILLKDEAANASGSFKARRASISAYEAVRKGYRGMVAATSGNYGAAVASQAAQRGLKCIIVQEVFDSRGVGQPEIVEKGRACEATGPKCSRCRSARSCSTCSCALWKKPATSMPAYTPPSACAALRRWDWRLQNRCASATGKTPRRW